MNFRKKGRGALPTLQMTAMMDVVFLLLCFFVTTSVFSQWENEIDITLPTAKTATVPDRMPGEIILNVARDGAVTVNQHALSLDELGNRLRRIVKFYPGQPIIIRGDKATPYAAIIRVVDACRAADVWNFSLATRDEDRK